MTTWMAATYGKSSKLHLVVENSNGVAVCGWNPPRGRDNPWFDPVKWAIYGTAELFVHCKVCNKREKPE